MPTIKISELPSGAPLSASDLFESVQVSAGQNVSVKVSGTQLTNFIIEEGSWTPVPADASSGGNTSSGSLVGGRYAKMGRIVTAWGFINNISKTGLTGGNIFYVQGLPFQASLIAAQGACVLDRFTAPTSVKNIVAELGSGLSAVRFQYTRDDLTDISATVNDIFADGGSDIRFTITYITTE